MRDQALASVIIPVWRDAAALAHTLAALPPHGAYEVIVAAVAGGEAEYESLRASRPDIAWTAGPRGRAAQMNAGASAARGEWLVFLHADSRLPADWQAVLRRAGARRDVVGGAFRLALDSRDWRARLIEWGVRLRVAAFGLPYGDQGLFVRRDVFAALGGYADWPLMEDVDLVRRLKRAGRLWHASSAVVTSARRWERDGWVQRSVGNVALACRFFAGASPARLAQRYHQRPARALVMMARAPWTEGKTRLRVGADDDDHRRLRFALFLDTLDAVRSLPDVQHVVACEPPEETARMRDLTGEAVELMAQRGGDLGARIAHVFEDAFRLGADSVVVIGSDLPDLPAARLAAAFDALSDGEARIVVGPAEDGGYYLIGMNRLHPQLFEDIEWQTARVLDQTLRAAARARLRVSLLDRWRDVDEPRDLERLAQASDGRGAVRTRAWLATEAGRAHPARAVPRAGRAEPR